MNKLLLFFSVFIVLLSVGAATAIPTPTSAFNFNNNNFSDQLGVHNGTNFLTTNITGKVLDGRLFSPTAAAATTTNVSLTGYSLPKTSVSVSIWVKTTLTGGYQGLWGAHDGTSGYLLYIDPSGNLGIATNNVLNNLNTSVGTSGVWQHIVLTRDNAASNRTVVWINDTVKFNGTITGGPQTTNWFMFGAGIAFGGFNGTMDIPIIWEGQVLNQTDVDTLWNTGNGVEYPFTTPTNNSFSITARDNLTSSNLTTFNSTISNNFFTATYNTSNGTIQTTIPSSPTPLTDWSGNGNTITIGNNVSYNQAVHGYTFNSSSSSSGLPLSDLTNFTENNDFTMSVSFICSNTNCGTNSSASAGLFAKHFAVGIYFTTSQNGTNARPRFGVRNSTSSTQAAFLSGVTKDYQNTEQNVLTVTYNASNRLAILYQNGIQIQNGTVTTTNWTVSGTTWIVGNALAAIGGTDVNFNGTVTNAALWNRTLSDTETVSVYNNQTPSSGLVAWYPFVNATTPLTDASGNGATLALSAGSLGVPLYSSLNNTYTFNSALNESLEGNTSNVTIGNYSIGTYIYLTSNQSNAAAALALFDVLNDNPSMSIGFSSSGSATSVGCAASLKNTTGSTSANPSQMIINLNQWYRVDCVYSYNGSAFTTAQFINGQNNGSTTVNNIIGFEFNTTRVRLGSQKTTFQRFFNGSIANPTVYTTNITQVQITSLVNNQTPTTNLLAWYPFLDSTLATVTTDSSNYLTSTNSLVNISTGSLQANLTPYASVVATDVYDNSSLSGFIVEYNGTNYTSVGTTARIPATTEIYNITFYNTSYFTRQFINIANRSLTFTAPVYQAVATFNASEIISALNIANFTVNTTSIGSNSSANYPSLYLKAGTYQITFSKNGWYSNTQNFTIAANTNYTYNFSNTYGVLLNVSVQNRSSSTAISRFTITIASGSYAYNITGSTTNGTYVIPWVNDTNLNISVNSTGIANTTVLWNTSNYTGRPVIANITILAYTSESINFRFYDETTGLLLNGTNVTTYLTGSIISYNFTATNGTYYIDLLTPETYTITYGATGYDSRQYFYTVSSGSTTNLSLYLLNTTLRNLELITVQDTGQIQISGATVELQKKNLSGTNYYLVEMCMTNGLGQCILHANLYDTTYRILVDYNGSTRFNSNDTQLSQSAYTFTISTELSRLTQVLQLNNIQYSLTYSNTSNNFTFTWNDLTGNTQTGCLKIDRWNQATVTTISNLCSSSASGTQVYTITPSTGDQFVATAYITYDSGEPAFILSVLGVNTNSTFRNFGTPGLFIFGFIVLGTIMFASLWNPIAPVVTGLIALFTMNALGIMGLPLTVIGSVAIVGFIIVMVLRQ